MAATKKKSIKTTKSAGRASSKALPGNKKAKKSSSKSLSKAGGKVKRLAGHGIDSRVEPLTKITTYLSGLRWLYEHTNVERMRVVPYNSRTFSLQRMGKLLGLLGNPHEQLKCVQVAGTKGKGSTCAMLASMLRACGYTVGLYSSPHLVDLCERISIDGQQIGNKELTDLFKRIAENEKKLGDSKLSFFEIMTAAGLAYFADQAVDIVILETGLGGRLDSTTIVEPLVSGMTQISHDHMNILGKELTSIAKEKAGIFKKGIPAVSVAQDPEVVKVLDDAAALAETELVFTGREINFSYRFEATPELGPHTRVCVATGHHHWEHLPVPLRGEHQAHNCGLALALLDKLKDHGFETPEQKVIQGLAKTQLAGRMEQVWDRPRVLVDGAHNASSITALIRALGAHIAYDSLVLIFGCGQDKDVAGMLEKIALGADKVIFTRARSNPRACEPTELIHSFSEISPKMAQWAPNLKEALQLAARAVGRDDMIVITGSFYMAGEGKKYFAKKAADLAEAKAAS